MISSLILLATFIVLGIPVALLLIPWSILTGNVQPLYDAAQWVLRTGFAFAGIRVEVRGRDQIPRSQACIFMANHVSNLDPPALIPNIPGRTSAFLKRSLMRIPVLGWGLKQGEFIPVDRSGDRESAQESAAEAHEVLQGGVHLTIFVEGTRSRDGRMLPFKKGPFFLAKDTGAFCIPVSIWGTEKLMSKGSMRIQRGTAHVTFHPPLNPADFETRDDLMAAVRQAIASGLPEWMRT